jgi:hypothetical protein
LDNYFFHKAFPGNPLGSQVTCNISSLIVTATLALRQKVDRKTRTLFIRIRTQQAIIPVFQIG